MLSRYSETLFAILRIIAGLMFMFHGTQKLFGFPERAGGGGGELPPLMLAAGIIELVCGFLIAIGFFTSIAAFIASGQMAVAYFMSHAPQGFWPMLNRGEHTVLYCFLFLYIAARGAGPLSVDATRKKGAAAR